MEFEKVFIETKNFKIPIDKSHLIKQGKISDDYISWNTFIAERTAYIGGTDTEYERDRPVVIVHTGETTGRPQRNSINYY